MFGQAAAVDPYLFGSSFAGSAGSALCHATPSPPGGAPKLPKTRVPIKDSAKPAGPIHVGTGGTGREALIQAKRATLAEAAPTAQPQEFVHFVLQDDDPDVDHTRVPATSAVPSDNMD